MPKCIGHHSKRVFPYSWSILSFFPTRCYLKSSLDGPWKPLRPIEYPGTTSGPKPCKNSTGREFNASNHQGGPQGWLRWVITRSIIFKSFCDMIFKIYSFLHWNASKSPLKTKMAFLQQKECPNKKIEENQKVLELNFLSNSNCASLGFEIYFLPANLTEP